MGFEKYLMISDVSPSGLVWAVPSSTRTKVGSPAFTNQLANGYYQGGLHGKNFYAHRVVFFLAYGFFPAEVDHIDGNRGNNHPSNLRAVSRSENQHNRLSSGATYNTRKGKWQARIRVAGVRKSLGLYNTKQEAHAAYLAAKAIYHPTAPARCYGG